MSSRTLRIVGMGLFVVGVLMGLTIATMAVWANVEAAHYGFPHFTTNHLGSLSCPHFLAWDERSAVRVQVTNTNDHPSTMGIKSWVSVPLAWELQTEHRKLQPGETWRWSREVGPENRELRHFVFVSVYTFGGYPIPERQGICGIYVLPIRGVRGDVAMAGAVFLALLMLVGGWWLWRRGGGLDRMQAPQRWTLYFFLVAVPLTLAAALWSAWMLGAALLVADGLMVVIVGLSALMQG